MRDVAKNRTREKELVARCVTGDRDAWEALVCGFETTVYFALRNALLVNGHQAPDDLVDELQSEVFFRLIRNDFTKLRQFQGRCSLKHWLKVVVGNFVIDFLRKRRPSCSLDDPRLAELRDAIPSDNISPEDSVASLEARQLLRELWDVLAHDDRRFVELFYEQQLSFAEVAAEMRTSIGAVYARKNRVRKKLATLLRKRDRLSKVQL